MFADINDAIHDQAFEEGKRAGQVCWLVYWATHTEGPFWSEQEAVSRKRLIQRSVPAQVVRCTPAGHEVVE